MVVPATPTPQIELSISGYNIVEQIYAGSRTIVYRALENSSQRLVVIKLLQQAHPSFNELLQFRNQYTITKNLNIANIICPYNLVPCGNSYALVMEDFGGISLRQYVQQHSLSLLEILGIALQLTHILHDLHQARIIHKDIKPANILIQPASQQVKLIDFSIASRLPKETQEIKNPGGLEGTLAYLAPEQTGRMNRGIDYRADFYALGVTLFELLTGQLPFPSIHPMELVHCHIAKQPPALQKLNLKNSKFPVPVTIAQIVLKLMAKNAEDRYQSALGLKHDLQNCLTQFQETGAIQPFEPGARDVCDRFLIPERLYGRATEVQTLLNAFDRVAKGRSEMMVVAGFSGIGKTAVVNEVHKPITHHRGYFAKGKFDQFNRNRPFSAFVQALQDLIGQLLSESDAQLTQWRTQILEALGDNGQILIEVMPELERIIGKQLPVPELSGVAAQNRFNLSFQKFIAVFTTPDHPLVIFLDDLQWADLASLQLIKLLMEDESHLFLLGAYRDNEVSPTHPLILTLEELKQAGKTVNAISLTPLSFQDTNKLLADTLHCSTERSRPLTELLNLKTQGNPFFTIQSLKALHNDGWITFNPDQGCWECDMTQLHASSLTDDVVELMAQQLQKLPSQTQQVLKLAACIGNQFNLKTLAIVSEQSQTETTAALWQALQEGLVLPISETYKFFLDAAGEESDDDLSILYRFFHDRIQQAAYSLIPEAEKQRTHLTIGQLLLQSLDETQQDEPIFELVNQLNCGISLITSLAQRQQYAQLNLSAGRKAKESTAYGAAAHYLDYGMQFLMPGGWQTDADLMHRLHEEAAEVALLTGNFEQMEALIQEVLQHSSTLLDQLKVYELKLQAYQIQNQQLQAITVGREILQKLGVMLPESVSPSAIKRFVERTLAAIPDGAIANLVNLPQIQDINALAALRIMISLVPSIHQAAPHLFPIIACEEVNLSLKYGNSPLSAPGYADFGIVVSTVLNQLETGYQVGQLALRIMDQYSEKSVKSMVQFKVAAFNQSNRQNIQQAIQLLKESYQVGLETGDSVHALVSTSFRLLYTYLCGAEDLEALLEEVEIYQSRFSTSQHFLTWAHILRCSIKTLIQFSETPAYLGRDAEDEEQRLSALLQENDELTLHLFYLNKLILNYTFGHTAAAVETANQGATYLKAGMGMPSAPVYYYYDALVHLSLYPTAEPPQQQELLSQVVATQEKLRIYATAAPMNYQHKYDLVEAVRCHCSGNRLEAIDAYDHAIAGAKANGYFQDEALANELAAQFYLDWGKAKVAAGYMQEAYYGYTRWGAKGKTDDLKNRYPDLLHPILQSATQPVKVLETLATIASPNLSIHQSTDLSDSSSTNINTALDFVTILKASHSFSGTIQLDELLHQLSQVILQNSGGDRCALILPNHANEWEVKAIATPETTELCAEPLEGNANLPLKLIQYVKNTQAVVMIDDLYTDLPVIDDYLRQRQPRSLLCLPILNQGQLIGILYLKNRSTSGVFTSDRILILNFLCTQAAISLENARLYQASQANAQQLEQSLVQQKILFKVVTQMRKSLDLETIFQSVTQNVRSTLKADRVGIYQFHPEQNYEYGEFIAEDVQPEFPSALATQVRDHCFGEDYAVLYQQGRICALSNVQAKEIPDCHRAILQQFAIQASLVVPILQDEKLWGLLCIHQCDRPRTWQPTEIQFAQQVAAQMGIALQQTGLLLETRRQATQLEQTLQDLRQTQLQMVQKEKMASLGNLVAGVAHEINNPIGFLNGSINNATEYVQDLLEHLTLYQENYPQAAATVQAHAADIDLDFLQEDLPKLLNSMKGATDRIKAISTSLRTFSRADTEHKVSANLHEGIDSALLILKYRLQANQHRPEISVIKDYGELPPIECFPGQLNQVFMNILANAIDMFDEMAKTEICTNLEARPQQITIRSRTSLDQVQIQIGDNGKGIPEDIKAKVFDHLFTTKGVGQGTGLGLAIARQIVVEKHQGNLWCDSVPGQGTQFFLEIPLYSN